MESLDKITTVQDLSCPERRSVKKKVHTRCLPVSDPTKEAELLEAIDAAYYIEDDFDSVEYELKKIVESSLMPDALNSEVKKLKKQLQVVSKRISTKIMENSPSYSAKLQDVDEIQNELSGVIATVSTIRNNLGVAKGECRKSLEIIANYRNHKHLRRLKASLKTVKTLYEIEFQLKDFIQEGNFPEAITLCREAQNAAASCCHFYCIRELAEKLKSTMDGFMLHLHSSLASLTVIFDPDKYAPVYRAYKMLSKVREGANEIVKCFHETLESSSRRVLAERIISHSVHTDIDALSYEQLCEAIEAEQMLDCVRELGFVLCKILFTYHAMLRYHIEDDERLTCTETKDENADVIRAKLADSLYSVFKTASQKFNTLLCCHDLSVLKFDNFLDIVEMSNRFKHFGRTYFGNACGEVAISLEKQTYLYFGRYHSERMEELKMFLENEAFALCPVPVQFTLFDLQEFYFLKESTECFDDGIRNSEVEAGLGEQLDYQLIPLDMVNPFSSDGKNKGGKVVTVAPQRKLEYTTPSSSKSIGMNGDVSISAVNCQTVSSTSVENSQQLSPILCNTALNLLRFFGGYIRMTYLLRSIAEQAMFAIFQLFSYFLYTVHSFFSCDEQPGDFQFSSLNLAATLKYAKENVLRDEASTAGGDACRVLPGSLSSLVQLHDPQQIYALSERIVGVESVVFLAKQLNVLHPILESLVSSFSAPSYFTEFLAQILPSTFDIRKSVYGCVANRVLRYNQLTAMVSSTKWDISELQSQHSAYVDFLIQEMKSFGTAINNLCKSTPLPREIVNVLWDCVIYRAFRAIVQGYCDSSRKCSSEGRALMQLDLQQMSSKIEQLTDLRPIPHKAYVENYIKAYYLPESSLEQWILQHSEYSAHQMVSLLNVASHVSKRARMRIIGLLTE